MQLPENLSDIELLLALAIPFAIRLVVALLIFFIGKAVARRVIAIAAKLMEKRGIDPMLIRFIDTVAYALALVVIVIAALGQLGIDTTSALAVLGGAALAVGLALQGQLSSFAAGVMLILVRPFKAGDFVDAGGVMGIVEEIRISATYMRTPDNQVVIVPNSQVWGSTITNYSTRDTRRMELTIGISYGSDLLLAKKLLVDLIAAEPRIFSDPEPTVQLKDLSANSLDFVIRAWMKSSDWWNTRCDMLERIKLTFDEHGIEIPFAQMDLHVRELPAQTDKAA